MNRKFYAIMIAAGMSILIGGMACTETQVTLDRSDETDGAT